jgi:hypothetical protein
MVHVAEALARATSQTLHLLAIRGRVLGLYGMAGMGLRAFSGITVGVGGSLIGIHWSLALSALLLLAITLPLQLWMRSAVFESR